MLKHRRLGDLVRQSGRPEIAWLWSSPTDDRPFARAIRENRVLTVIQKPGSQGRDVGQIGFHRNRFASYFVFPRPLPKDGPNRVIGINYQLVEEPDGKDLVGPRTKHATARLQKYLL
jgi:hypothetical protein